MLFGINKTIRLENKMKTSLSLLFACVLLASSCTHDLHENPEEPQPPADSGTSIPSDEPQLPETDEPKSPDYGYERFGLAETGIPVLFLETADGEDITSKEDWKDATFYFLDGGVQSEVFKTQIKGRGNSSWSQPKKPYSLKLSQKSEILGMKKHKRWVLVANYSDKTLIRNSWVSYIGNEIFDKMKWNPHFKPVDLVLNGEYKGSYIIGEQIKIDDNRVNIADVSKKGTGAGGFVCEINTDTRWESGDFNFKTSRGLPITLKDPGLEDISSEMQEFITRTVQAAEDALFSENFADEKDGYAQYIDVPSFIDWYLVNELTKNNDAVFFTSCYLYYDPELKKICMGPDWDFDISCGNIDYNGCDDSSGFWIKNARWYKQLFTDPQFESKVKARWEKVRTQVRSAVDSKIISMAEEVRKSAEQNFARWEILGTYVWPNAAGYQQRTTYQSEIDYMQKWLSRRIEWLDSQF